MEYVCLLGYYYDLFWSKLLLTGLHSYAAGEAAQIPNYVYWGFALMVVLALLQEGSEFCRQTVNEPYFLVIFVLL